MRLGIVVVALAASACVRSDTIVCGDELCAAGTTCVAVTTAQSTMETRCALPAQLEACDGIENDRPCTLAGATSATCIGGACFPDICGDRLRGASEACDDANVASGDGCSSDCRSNEVCGNGVVDPLIVIQGVSAANEQCDDGNFLAHDGCSLCDVETPRWSFVPHLPPLIRAHHGMAADTYRHEVVMFGGTDPSYVTPKENWIWNGTTWRARESDLMPPGRIAMGLAYDSARDRLVMFGGGDPSFSVFSRDLWEWNGKTWEERVAAGPSNRMEHSMAFDSIRDVTVLYGGLAQTSQAAGYVDETWLWNGTTWTLHQPALPEETPPKGSRAAMAFDPVRGEMVMFGGANQVSGLSNQTWLFDGARWRRAAPAQSPPARLGAMMAWDPTTRRVILFGGLDTALLGDTWAWDGTTWTPLSVAGPPARSSSAMASDFERGGVVLYGGADNSAPTMLDTWWWDGAAWHDETRTYVPRFLAIAAATDTTRDVIVAFGGTNGPVVDTTQEYVRGSWFLRTVSPRPGPRHSHQMVYMSSIGKVVVWGGITTAGALINDGTWGWDGTTWERLATAANTPVRMEIASTFDAEHGEIVMFGGHVSTTAMQSNETWVFDGTTWTLRTPATSPPARGNATLGYDPLHRRVVLTGGQNDDGFALDLWTWNGSTWTEHAQPTRPPARVHGKLIWNARRGRLLFAGGFDLNSNDAEDVWELEDLTWLRVNATAAPLRGAATIVPTVGGVMRISGTIPPGTLQGEMWRLRWEPDAPDEVCTSATDIDGDALVGCADPDCDERCTGCGDGGCSGVESCHFCSQDCGPCVEHCGDAACGQAESPASCPSDC